MTDLYSDFAQIAIPSMPTQDDMLAAELHKLAIESAKNDINLKKDIFYWVRYVVSGYLIFVGGVLIVLVGGWGHLDSAVIIALLTTTTVNVLGLPYIIVRSLFK